MHQDGGGAFHTYVASIQADLTVVSGIDWVFCSFYAITWESSGGLTGYGAIGQKVRVCVSMIFSGTSL